MPVQPFKSPPSKTDNGEGLARNLSAARIAAGLTQQVLADRSGVSRATIALIEAGRSDPRRSTIGLLAGALGISPLVLLVEPSDVVALTALPSSRSSPAATIGESIGRALRLDAPRVASLAAFAVATATRDRGC